MLLFKKGVQSVQGQPRSKVAGKLGKPSNHTLCAEGKKTYSQNKGFDANRDGKITLKEISTKIRQKYEKGLGKGYLG